MITMEQLKKLETVFKKLQCRNNKIAQRDYLS